MPWDFWLILLFLLVGLPLLGKRRIRHLLEHPLTTQKDRLRLYISTIASQWLAVAVILWRASARSVSLAQLGLAVPRPIVTFVISIVLTGLIVANQVLSIRELAKDPSKQHGILPQLAVRIFPQDNFERAVFIPLVLTVAFCEEVIYRGFVQAVFQHHFPVGAVLVGILGSSLLFSIAHFYQGSRGMFATFVVGLVFSIARAWTGSIVPAMVSHGVADAIAGLLTPNRLSQESQANLNLHT